MPEPLTVAALAIMALFFTGWTVLLVRRYRARRRTYAAARLYRKNLAAIKHELETPWRGHDPDGACCRAATEETR